MRGHHRCSTFGIPGTSRAAVALNFAHAGCERQEKFTHWILGKVHDISASLVRNQYRPQLHCLGVGAARYLWPELRSQPRADALRPLVLLHSFRFIGLPRARQKRIKLWAV